MASPRLAPTQAPEPELSIPSPAREFPDTAPLWRLATPASAIPLRLQTEAQDLTAARIGWPGRCDGAAYAVPDLEQPLHAVEWPSARRHSRILCDESVPAALRA